MKEKMLKLTRVVVLLLMLFSLMLNHAWQGGKPDWPYWVSRFLISSTLLFFGFLFSIFPNHMTQLIFAKEQDYLDFSKWRRIAIGLVIGVPVFLLGIEFFSITLQRWIAECSDLTNCLG